MLKKVYIFESDGKYKIGVSKDTELRLKQLKCALPNIKSIFESNYMSNPYKVEAFLHHIFNCYSVGGEWFSKVDIDKVKNIIEMISETEEQEIKILEEKRKEHDEYFHKLFYGTIENIKKDMVEEIKIEELKEENSQIEKFTQAINGMDIPNIYSDLIYVILFRKNTEELIKQYNPNRFESFRAKLGKSENDKIDILTMLTGSLINCGWGYAEIKDFVAKESIKMLD